MDDEIATCIGCGCDDMHACYDAHTGETCSWERLDRGAHLGVCSQCKTHVERWDRGDRQPAVPMRLPFCYVLDGQELRLEATSIRTAQQGDVWVCQAWNVRGAAGQNLPLIEARASTGDMATRRLWEHIALQAGVLP